jgi:late competence protein required for DNA uptake (superfamily II DNA/RNA helicase)
MKMMAKRTMEFSLLPIQRMDPKMRKIWVRSNSRRITRAKIKMKLMRWLRRGARKERRIKYQK